MASISKNVASQHVKFGMVVAATGAADTAATVTVYVTKDGGAQATSSGTVTNLGNGQYDFAPTQSDTNATDVGFAFTASGDVPVFFDFHTDVVDANGLLEVDATYINAVSASALTTINANLGTTQAITFDANNYQKVDLVDIAGSALSTSSAQIGVNLVNIAGTATAGAAGYVGIDWSKVSSPTSTVGLSGTTISTSQAVASVSGAVGSVTGSVASVTGNVGGNVTGSVGSVTGNVGGSVASVTAAVAITSNVKKDTASNGFEFIMTSSTTHAPQTGLTVTSQVSIDGGSFGSTANSAVEIGSGAYYINLAASDVNGNHIMLLFTASGADAKFIEIVTQP